MYQKYIPINISQSKQWREMALVFLALAYSGNDTVGKLFPTEPQLVILALFLGFLLEHRGIRPFSSQFLAAVAIFGGILLVQCVDYAFYPVVTIAGFFVRLFIGYALMRLVPDFPRVFVRAMVALALLSFLFHIPYVLLSTAGISLEGPITRAAELLGTASSARRPLFLHTFMGYFSFRNAGMFWEPGAFAGYLILGLIFLAVAKKNLSREQYRRAFLILTIAILTTLSTTGYVVYPLILLLHYGGTMQTKNKISAKIMFGMYIFLPVIIGCSFIAYNKLPFLKEKISHQMDMLDREEGNWHVGRIGSIVFDWEYIKRRPLTGWGLHRSTRYSLNPEIIETPQGMGNGFSDFMATFGITGMLIWLFYVFRGMMHLTNRNLPATMFILLILCLVLQGEAFFNFPLFLGLMFLCVPRSLPAFSKSHVHRSYYVQT